ncbi:MAG: hypothetical protein QF368_13355 [SAR202 cluster bacterium]|nr:hypothetical protein [SAR202 cluster bacterium]
MGVWTLVKAFSGRLESVMESLTDALPPYRTARGILDAKETCNDGKFYIHVADSRVEVDEATCQTLEIGEMLKVRYTRGDRAINIDRYLPQNDVE